MKPEGEMAKELEEIVAKRQKKGKVDDDKPLEEKSIFHSEFIYLIINIYSQIVDVYANFSHFFQQSMLDFNSFG